MLRVRVIASSGYSGIEPHCRTVQYRPQLSANGQCQYRTVVFLQDLEEQKRTKYKINGTATTAIVR